MHSYVLNLCMLTIGSDWSMQVLKALYCQVLTANIFTELAGWDDQASLDSFLDLDSLIDLLLRTQGEVNVEVNPTLWGSITMSVPFIQSKSLSWSL